MHENKAYSYSDVYLVPKYSALKSRSEAETSVKFLDRTFKLPVVPSNMASVIDENLAKTLAFEGYFYIMHRFGDTRKFLQRTRSESWPYVSISIGVKESDLQLITDIQQSKCRVDAITIDIAHGHCERMKVVIAVIKHCLPGVKVIAGNVCTGDAVIDLAKWGADAVKIGIAGGHACSTKNQTGFHVPMFSCIKECLDFANRDDVDSDLYSKLYNVEIIADGGIRENGDIVKAIVAGADMVMAGSIFAACCDSPGEYITKYAQVEYSTCESDDPFTSKHLENGDCLKQQFRQKIYKGYHGSASAKQKGEKKHVEGFELEIPCNGMNYFDKLIEIKESLQSAISYSGGTDISQLKYVQYVVTK